MYNEGNRKFSFNNTHKVSVMSHISDPKVFSSDEEEVIAMVAPLHAPS